MGEAFFYLFKIKTKQKKTQKTLGWQMFIGFIRGLRFEIICYNFSWGSFCSFNASVWVGASYGVA